MVTRLVTCEPDGRRRGIRYSISFLLLRLLIESGDGDAFTWEFGFVNEERLIDIDFEI